MTKKVLLYFALLLWFVVPILAQPTILVEDKFIEAGDNFYVDVKVVDFPDFGGMQFSINWDPTKLAFDSIAVDNISVLPSYSVEGSFSTPNIESGFFATSWTEPSGLGIELADSAIFFRIHFAHIGSIGDSIDISITDNPLVREFISEENGTAIFEPTVENGTIIVLNPTSIDELHSVSNPFFALSQNEPNPFTHQTTIPFEVFRSLDLSIEIYDTKGLIVLTERSIYPPGKHAIEIDAEQLPASGIYYYKLKTKDFFITNRMILVR